MQKLAEICIRRPVFAAMLVLALVVVGAVAYRHLGVDRFPAVDIPQVRVRAILPGAGIADHEALSIETARAVGLELAPPTIRHITTIYGDRCAAIVRLMAEKTDWRMPLVPGRPTVGAEVIHAFRHESACTLADVVIRRTELGAMGHPGADMVTAMAGIAAEELGWDPGQQSHEVAAVDQFYRDSQERVLPAT